MIDAVSYTVKPGDNEQWDEILFNDYPQIDFVNDEKLIDSDGDTKRDITVFLRENETPYSYEDFDPTTDLRKALDKLISLDSPAAKLANEMDEEEENSDSSDKNEEEKPE